MLTLRPISRLPPSMVPRSKRSSWAQSIRLKGRSTFPEAGTWGRSWAKWWSSIKVSRRRTSRSGAVPGDPSRGLPSIVRRNPMRRPGRRSRASARFPTGPSPADSRGASNSSCERHSAAAASATDDGSKLRRCPGRPGKAEDIQALVIQFATENIGLGAYGNSPFPARAQNRHWAHHGRGHPRRDGKRPTPPRRRLSRSAFPSRFRQSFGSSPESVGAR